MSTSPTRFAWSRLAPAASLLVLTAAVGLAASLVLRAGRSGAPAPLAALRRTPAAEPASPAPRAARLALAVDASTRASEDEPASTPTDWFDDDDPAVRAARTEALRADLGPAQEAEWIAWLAYLRAQHDPETWSWHERAVIGGRAHSDRDGVGLAEVALDALRRAAASEADARATLARLAFETPDLAGGLRRRAAASLAAHSDEAGLAALVPHLARELDPVLVEGVLAAVAERAPSAARTRLLAAHGRAPTLLEPATAAREE